LPPLFAVSGVTMWRLRRARSRSRLDVPDLILEEVNAARRAGE